LLPYTFTVRDYYTDYEDQNKETVQVESMVLTINVEGRFIGQMKDLIKSIKWDESIFGILIDENPAKRNDHIMTMYKHNNLCMKSAYVKLEWMPETLLNCKLPILAPLGFSKSLLKKQVKDSDGKTVNLIRSINKIRGSSGMYFLITTKELLETAETTVTEIVEKINKSTLRLGDNSFPDNMETTVYIKSSSKAGSEISEFSRVDKTPKIDENDPEVAQGCRSMIKYASKISNRSKGPPKNIKGKPAPKKSYAETASLNKPMEMEMEIKNKSSKDIDSFDKDKDDAKESVLLVNTSKFDQLDIEETTPFRTTMDSRNQLLAEMQQIREEKEKVEGEKEKLKKMFKEYMENCNSKLNILAAENKELRDRIKNMENQKNKVSSNFSLQLRQTFH
jgi:hypothetical protein